MNASGSVRCVLGADAQPAVCRELAAGRVRCSDSVCAASSRRRGGGCSLSQPRFGDAAAYWGGGRGGSCVLGAMYGVSVTEAWGVVQLIAA